MKLAEWEAARVKLPCSKCVGLKKIKNKTPNCKKCKPIVLDSNLIVLHLLEGYATTIITDYGLSAEGIKLALQEPWMDDNEKAKCAKKIVIYLNALKSALNKDNPHG